MQIQSQYDRIIKWFNITGQDKSPDLYLKLIKEEYEELFNAVLNSTHTDIDWKDKDVAKEVGDLIWVSVLMLHCMGYDHNKIIELIADSNFSKFARSKEEAEESLDWYFENKKEKGDYVYRDGYYVIQREDGKILKNKSTYYEPEWSELT